MPPIPKRVATRWTSFSVVSLDAACETTGLSPDQLLTVRGVEGMTRTQDGREEQAVRIPTEILEAAGLDKKRVAELLTDYGNSASDAELRAQIRAIIDAHAASS